MRKNSKGEDIIKPSEIPSFNSIREEEKVQCMYLYLIGDGRGKSDMKQVAEKVYGNDDQGYAQRVSLIHRAYNFSQRNSGKYAPGCKFERMHSGYRVTKEDIIAFVRQYPKGIYMQDDYSFEKFLEEYRIGRQENAQNYNFDAPESQAWYTADSASTGNFSAGGYAGGGYSGDDYGGYFWEDIGEKLRGGLKILVVLMLVVGVFLGIKTLIANKTTNNSRLPVTGKVSEKDKQAAPLTVFRLGDNVYYMGQQSWWKPTGLCARYAIGEKSELLTIGTWSQRMCKGITMEMTGELRDGETIIRTLAMGTYKKSDKNGWVVYQEYEKNQTTIACYKNGYPTGDGVIICGDTVQLHDFKKDTVIGYFRDGQWVTEDGKKVAQKRYKSITTTDGKSFIIGEEVYIQKDGDMITYRNGDYSISGNKMKLTYQTKVKECDVTYCFDVEEKMFGCDWNGDWKGKNYKRKQSLSWQ